MLKHFPWKRKPWKLEWRDLWTKKTRSRSFYTEEEARTFELVQMELFQKEKTIMAQAKRKARRSQPGLTVNEILDAYLERPNIRENTRAASAYHTKTIRELLGQRKVESLTPEDVKAFIRIERGRGLHQSTANRRAGVLRAACNWAVEERLIKESPLTGLKLPHSESYRISPPTIQELDKLYSIAPEHIRRIILLGLYTGARIGQCELFRLTWDAVEFSTGMIYMPCAYKNKKSGDGRYIPIREDLIVMLKEWYRKDGDCPWVINFCGKPVRRINSTWRLLCHKAGISRRIRPYDLRHAFATLAMANSGDIASVAELMGHSNYTMLLHVYQHVMQSQKIKAVAGIPAMKVLKNANKKD